MQITVEYAAQVKRAAGVAAETLQVEAGCSHQQLARQVANRHGDPLKKLLFGEDGELHSSILMFVGDEQVRWNTPTMLNDRDVVTILSPISGG